MKKIKFLGLIVVITLTSFNVQIKGEDYFSSILMENIEALSSGENAPVRCFFPGSIDCPGSSLKVQYVVE